MIRPAEFMTMISGHRGPIARDFFFVTDTIANLVSSVAVDMKTDASDHQPLILRLADV